MTNDRGTVRRAATLGAAAVLVACSSTSDSSTGPTDPLNESPLPVVATVSVPQAYGIHDMYVRDGIAFVCVWDSGVIVFDVGRGAWGGSPSKPVRVSSVVIPGGAAHNAWWFHNPATGEQRYLFVGQEGPGIIDSTSSGDIYVVDVSDLLNPRVVGSYHRDGAGTHNFWMDEDKQILYAAYYNGGVVAIDVSGTLPDTLALREISRIQPGGTQSTYVWGVHLFNGSLYASDMVSGFWQLHTANGVLSVAAGGNNVAERFTSDLWLANGYAYTGTWGRRGTTRGNALKVWALNPDGSPALVDSVITSGITTVSDVEVSASGKLLMFSTEGGGQDVGFYFYSLANPAHPTFLTRVVSSPPGIHTATFATINGRKYAFGAQDPSAARLVILDVTSLDP